MHVVVSYVIHKRAPYSPGPRLCIWNSSSSQLVKILLSLWHTFKCVFSRLTQTTCQTKGLFPAADGRRWSLRFALCSTSIWYRVTCNPIKRPLRQNMNTIPKMYCVGHVSGKGEVNWNWEYSHTNTTEHAHAVAVEHSAFIVVGNSRVHTNTHTPCSICVCVCIVLLVYYVKPCVLTPVECVYE